MSSSTSSNTHKLSSDGDAPPQRIVDSFIANALDAQQRQDLESQLQTFVLHHTSHHRPVALVTSGGTAADLEVHSVRCLDNFSTGTRGAASIEALLRKGYAVIHLWRTGSASPFGRVLAESVLGLSSGDQGISTAALGKLFVGDAGTGDSLQDEEDRMVQSVLNESNAVNNNNHANEDPWLTDPSHNIGNSNSSSHNNSNARSSSSTAGGASSSSRRHNKNGDNSAPIALHRRVEHSSRLQQALRERQAALQEGRLLTVPFRSIDEYLAKLCLTSTCLKASQTLALIYLAAAVSDFYVPPEQRSQHKIQSNSSSTTSGDGGDGGGGLTLRLEPVPKVMGLLRSSWCPDAFLCSFKLETDPTLLRHKAERAVQKYGCHMVVGNILETRYTEVHVLAPPTSSSDDNDLNGDSNRSVASAPALVSTWPMHAIRKPRNGGGDPDGLENQLIDVVVQAHFEYIATRGNDHAGTDAVLKAHYELEESQRQRQREVFWAKVKTFGLEWAGVALGALLSYTISTALRRRMGA